MSFRHLSIILTNLFWMVACGQVSSQNSSSKIIGKDLNQTPNIGHGFIDEASAELEFAISDSVDTSTSDNPILARAIKNQIQTAFRYIPKSPFRLKKVISTDANISAKLIELDIIANGGTTKDIKNNLKVNTSIASGELTVNYLTEQQAFDVTIYFEDDDSNLYPFQMTMDVNNKTDLEIIGSLNVDVLKVLPASVQHVLTAMFDEVFTVGGSSNNKLTWTNQIPHTMLPLVNGEVSKFQIHLIDNVLLPLCSVIMQRKGLSPAIACKNPNLHTTPVTVALDQKIKKRQEEFGTIDSDTTTVTSLPAIDSSGPMKHITNCEFFNRSTTLFSTKFIYHYYVPANQWSDIKFEEYNLYLQNDNDQWTKDSYPSKARIISTAPLEKCHNQTSLCFTAEVLINGVAGSQYKFRCEAVASGMAKAALSLD